MECTKMAPFTPVKQPRGSKLCTAAVTAMAARLTMQEVLAQVRLRPLPGDPVGYLPDTEMYRFLGERGIVCGMQFSALGIEGCDELVLTLNDPLNRPAILGVKSKRFLHAEHSVFFDGKDVFDPDPDTPDRTRLRDYAITMVMPLCFTKEADMSEAKWAATRP